MASLPARWLRPAFRPIRVLYPQQAHASRCMYHASAPLRSDAQATPTPPALLATIKQDLKAAMRSKDAPRLAVLRSVITATNNAAKTDAPVSTDVQLVALLRRNLRASREAVAEASAAGRPDLADKEEAQAKVLEDYIDRSGVVTVTEAQVLDIIHKVAQEARDAGVEAKSLLGRTMKGVHAALQNQDVEIDMKNIKALVTKAIGGHQ